jgi:hypothetical protein
MKRMLLTLALLLISATVFAQTPPGSDPLFSMKRLSLGAGVERETLRQYQTEDLAWRAVLPIAYNVLSPPAGGSGIRLSLTARVSQAFDLNEQTELWVGARVTLWRGAQ